MTSVNVTAVTNTVTVTEGDTTVVTVTTAGPQGAKGEAGPPKSIAIAQPKANDQFTLFFTQYATTLTQVVGLVRGDTPSVTFELRYGADRSTAGTLATVPETITNTTTGELVTVQNMPIPADRFLWIVVTAVSGQVEELNVCVEL